MDPQKITELANLLRNNGDKILNSEFTLTLSGCLLRALNDSFTLITDAVEIGSTQNFQVAKPINSKSPVFSDLQLIYDFVQKTTLLCIVHYPTDDYFEGTIDISKFRALRRLEVQKTQVRQIIGIQPLRAQLQQLICVKSLRNVADIITHCGGDNSNGFVWNELKIADFSYNNLQRVDSSLEFAQFLQHLNLRHNQLRSVEAVKWLPHLKTLDLSYNCLQCIPQFHMEAYKRLQSLNMSNNFVEDLMGIAKLDALTDLDLSDNCLLDHSCLLPLSALLTLKFLNLYGNPLYCHPKHRLATSQFLHKNTATVKFILDFEPLSKNEKAITGTQQLRHVGALNRYATKSSTASISSSRATPSTQTPASSVGSLRSFKFDNETSNGETTASVDATTSKKPATKIRTVEIEDAGKTPDEDKDSELLKAKKGTAKLVKVALTQSVIEQPCNDHLEAKKHIEELREKYGANWLQSGNAEMMHSVLGIESSSDTQTGDKQTNASRQLLDDYLGELSTTAMSAADSSLQTNQTTITTIHSSTPTDESLLSSEARKLERAASPIKSHDNGESVHDDTLYKSLDSSHATNREVDNSTLYQSVSEAGEVPDDSTINESKQKAENNEQADEPAHLKHAYAHAADEEPEVSEQEDDEETYIVYTTPRNEAIFLTISDNFLRERDTLTQRTKTKWSLKILESCDRIKSNTLRINFDTIKVDKKERIYTVEDGLCQELEKKLRDILSQRGLSEMNQTIYRCVNCTCQFSMENKYKARLQEIRCPDCRSSFVAEIHEIPKSLEKLATEKLSPAAIVEESPVTTPLVLQRNDKNTDFNNDNNSIGSANSLNESSSCSKITNSQSSFDSNQSVAGSSNTERDLEFNGESSDVDILSNPSQSSIEVLDHFATRKTSEERRISQLPQLETIDDHSYTQSFMEREFGKTPATTANSASNVESKQAAQLLKAASTITGSAATANTTTSAAAAGPLAHLNLTESSSSGSVTDSVCTAYEQHGAKSHAVEEQLPAKSVAEKIVAQNLLNTERQRSDKDKQKESAANVKKEESGISSMFGALFQSTNILMSSSKKLSTETSAQLGTTLPPDHPHAQKSLCQPYKFNFSDFNDIDHRLKLYFYQSKFEEESEHFKWLARGRIYNECTQTLCDGLVVMSTCKCYVMEAFAPEHDDVTKWLRQLVSVTVNRLECIQLLPWKLGLAFTLRDWGGFLLLLQDILRTDSLLLYFANNALPPQCELKYQPDAQVTKHLNTVAGDEKLKMFALLNGCEVSCGQAQRTFNICGLLTTDTRLCISSGKLNWLSSQPPTVAAEPDIEICLTQLMSNLVEVERSAVNIFLINFLDETQDQSEVWRCTFETQENADSCLNAIAQSWEQLFGVSLLNT